MELLAAFIDIVLHLDAHLLALTREYGVWVYAILFLIIYCETGLVITPFLPGDSLLFVAGALCGMGALQLELLAPLLMIAAFSGDNTNYWIGRLVGIRLLRRTTGLIKREHIDKTHAFYEKHGGKAIVLARFMPIIRTFAPILAGVGEMKYSHFLFYNIFGGFFWGVGLTFLGYYLGSVIPGIDKYLLPIIAAIIFLSILPSLIHVLRNKEDRERILKLKSKIKNQISKLWYQKFS